MPARRVSGGRGGHRVDRDRRLLALELVDGADPRPGGEAPLGRRIAATWALYGATIRMSVERDPPVRALASVHRPGRASISVATTSASASTDDVRRRRGRRPHDPGSGAVERRRRLRRWRQVAGPTPAGRRRTISEMKRTTAGCIRYVVRRKRPRSGGIVRASPSEVLERRCTGALRVDALAHLLASWLRIAEEDERVGRSATASDVRQAQLAGLVDEQDVDGLERVRSRPQPGVPAAMSTVRPASPGRRPRCRSVTRTPSGRSGVVASGLLDDAHGRAGSAPASDDPSRRLRDRLVRLGRDADPLPAADEGDDHPGPGPGLAGARRPLDREHPAVERQREPDGGIAGAARQADSAGRRSLPGDASAARRAGGRAPPGPAPVGRRCRAQHVIGEPRTARACMVVVRIGLPGSERGGMVVESAVGAVSRSIVPSASSIGDDRPGIAAPTRRCPGVDGGLADPELDGPAAGSGSGGRMRCLPDLDVAPRRLSPPSASRSTRSGSSTIVARR